MSEKQDQVLDHEYDGIREYDNRLPNWWLGLLYGTIAFAFGYWFYVQTTGVAPTQDEAVRAEFAAAAEAQLARMEGQELTNESLNLMATVPDRTTGGRELFNQFCVVCHGTQGEGKVGPNLTDRYWIHDPSPLGIHGTVTNGVPEKGMAAWGNQLGPRRVLDVVAFVLTLKDTNVPGKDPEGELVEAGGGNSEQESGTPADPEGPEGER